VLRKEWREAAAGWLIAINSDLWKLPLQLHRFHGWI